MINKKNFIALSLCVMLILIYAVLYVNQGSASAYLTKIGIDKDETLRIYNAEHADTKLADNFYRDSDIFNDLQINKYVYHFTISENSKFFKKNYIYSIYPEFQTLKMPIEYAYMKVHGDKYGNFVSKEKLKLDKLGPIQINLVMNGKIFYWLIFGLFTILFACYFLPFAISKLQSYMRKVHQNNTIVAPPPHRSIFTYLFILYILSLSLFLISQYNMVSLEGDNWLMSAVYDSFYMPYNTTIGWQRGRHFADLFMSLSMRPFGEMLISLGMKPLHAFNIFASIFTLLFYGIFFIACSTFLWLLNNRRNFKMIFVLVSLMFLLIIDGRIDYVTTAAYIGSAGIALLVWLPILYFFIYQKVFRIGSNLYLQSSMLFFCVYMASFQTETSTLPIFGLTLLMSIYMYIFRKHFITSLYTYYHMGLVIVLVPIAFMLTMISGRGQTQIGVMEKTTFFENITYVWHSINAFSSCIVIAGFIYFLYLILCCIKNRQLETSIYFQVIALFVGLLGVIGLACIRVPGVWLEIMLIGLILSLRIVKFIQNQNALLCLCGNFIFVGFVFCAILQNVNILERNFVKYYNMNTQETLIALFQNAEKNQVKEIVLTPKDIAQMSLGLQSLSDDWRAWPNRDISAWMKRYYVKTYIPISVSSNDKTDNNKE